MDLFCIMIMILGRMDDSRNHVRIDDQCRVICQIYNGLENLWNNGDVKWFLKSSNDEFLKLEMWIKHCWNNQYVDKYANHILILDLITFRIILHLLSSVLFYLFIFFIRILFLSNLVS